MEIGVCDDRYLVEGIVFFLFVRWVDLLVGVFEICSLLFLFLVEGDWVFRKLDCFFDDFWFCVRVVIFDVIKLVFEIFFFEEVWKVWDDVDIGGEILNFLLYDCIKFGDWVGLCGCGEVSIEVLDVCLVELLREYNFWCLLVLFFILFLFLFLEFVWLSCFLLCFSFFNKYFMRFSCFFLDRKFLK